MTPKPFTQHWIPAYAGMTLEIVAAAVHCLKWQKTKRDPFSMRSVCNLPWEAPSNTGETGGFGWRCLSRRRV